MEAVQEYKRLGEVEACFVQLKDVIEMRPIWHHTERRVKAHILARIPNRRIEVTDSAPTGG